MRGGRIGEMSGEDASAFVSYARADWARVEPIVAALRDKGVAVWIDTSSIEPTAEWWAEIVQAIEASDATIAFLSEAFLASTVCCREVETIHEKGKKLIPMTLGDVDPDDAPEWVSALQWISANSGRESRAIAGELRRAIDLDLAWSSEHARLLVRAGEWDQRGRPRSRLLRGRDVAATEAAVLQDRPPSQPQPTALQREYVAASRRNRGRLGAIIASVAVVVSLVTSALSIVALQQRQTAIEALAASEFRRLSTQSEAATTQSDALRLGLGALEKAGAAGRSDTEALVPLARALGRTDVPLMHFSGLAEPDSATGGQQGTDVSADGSTLAYVLSDGTVRVIDLWTLSERAVIKPFANTATGYVGGYQVGLDRAGQRLVRLFVPEYPEDGEGFQAKLEIYDLAGDTAERALAETVDLSSYPAAVTFGPDDGVVVVPEDEGTVSVVDLGGDIPDVVHLGTPEERSDASLLRVYFSIDGSRVCTIGENLQLFQMGNRPTQLLELPNDRFGFRCMPEPCGASPSNVMAVTRESSDIECVGPDGSTQGRANDSGSTLDPTVVALRGVDQDWEPGTRHRWLVERPQGEAVDPPYWFVTAPPDVVRPLGISYAVPMPGGPGIVSVGSDGDIDVWAIGSGVLPHEDELVAVDGISHLIGGQSLSSEQPLLALAADTTAGEAALVDATSGESATPARSLDLGETVYDQSQWLLPGGDILIHRGDGHVEVYPGGDAQPSEYDLDVAVDDAFDSPPIAVEGNLLVQSTGDSIDIVQARSGESLASTPTIDDTYCAVGASQGATRVAAVTCGSGGTPELQIWDDLAAERPTRQLPLAFSSPNAVALSDDGRTIAVAFTLGEVAVLHDGQWVEPPELTTAGADHNDFQRGWVDLDPLGQWMITRRDGRGVELWHLAGGGIEQVSHLSFEWRTDPPLSTRFDSDSLSILWNAGSGATTAVAVRWSLTDRSLRRHACAQIAGVVEAVEARDSRDIPRDVCDRTRGEGARPDPMPITTTTEFDGDPAEVAAPWHLDSTMTPLADGSSPTEVGVASDGAIWVAASSLNTLVRIDASGAMASYPIGDTNTYVHSLLPAAGGAMWFAGFQTFGQARPDGTVGLLPGFDDPSEAILLGDSVYAFVASGPSLLRATEPGVDFIPLDSELAGARVAAIAPSDDSSLWLGLDSSLDGSTGPALVRIPLDGGEVVQRIDLDEVAALRSLVRESDGGLWLTGTREDGSGVLGHQLPDGQFEYLDPPANVIPSHLLTAPDAVWFVSETHLGRVSTADNSMAVWPIPGAEQLTGMALAPDGSFWLTDGPADLVHHVTLVPQ
jgi:streptogramin lyase